MSALDVELAALPREKKILATENSEVTPRWFDLAAKVKNIPTVFSGRRLNLPPKRGQM